MTEYKMVEMPDLNGDGKRITYPKMVHIGQISTRELAQYVHSHTTFATAEVEGVIDAVCDAMASYLSMGYSVKIEGMGTFTAGLKLKEGVEREEADGSSKRNAASIEVGKVTFRQDNVLIQNVQKRTRLERAKAQEKGEIIEDKKERVTILLDYLKEHKQLRVIDYVQLTGLERSHASRELRQLATEGTIRVSGRPPHIYYYINNV